MKIIIFVFGLMLSFQCFATGFVSIFGQTNDGWTVVFDPEPPENVVTIWKEGKESESSHQSFKGHCKNTDSGFECDAEDKSPLSGTKYERHHVGSCDVESEYVCVEGCIKNHLAPRVMTQGYWEGDPDCGMTQEQIRQAQMLEYEVQDCWKKLLDYNKLNFYTKGWLNGNKINLREQPEVTGKILRVLSGFTGMAAGTEVKVVSSEQMCIAVGGKGGRWVKVEVDVDGAIESGFVFDAYITYQPDLKK